MRPIAREGSGLKLPSGGADIKGWRSVRGGTAKGEDLQTFKFRSVSSDGSTGNNVLFSVKAKKQTITASDDAGNQTDFYVFGKEGS